MATQWTAKADALADVLAKDLAQRLSLAGGLATAQTVVKSYDATDKAPVLTINGAVAGTAGGTIKIRGVATFGTDSLGNAQVNYGMPHEIILVTENVLLLATADEYQTITHIVGSLMRLGMLVKWYVTAAGTAPTLANLPANPTATFDNLQYPGVGSA